MKEVYILEHVYDKDLNEEVKFIGVFSTLSNAQRAIIELKNRVGFNQFPEECFEISKCILDDYEWKEGFIDCADAL